MQLETSRWEQFVLGHPLIDVPRQFAAFSNSLTAARYLSLVRDVTPKNGTALDVGTGTALAPVWLSLRSTRASGMDISPAIVSRAQHVNSVLGGSASYFQRDMFSLYFEGAARYDTIHQEGLFEFLTLPQVHSVLAQQTALANRIVFSVRTPFYSRPEEYERQTLLTVECWKEALEPFDVEVLEYYGSEESGGKDHILAVIRGRPVDADLLTLMHAHEQPLPTGVTCVILAQNEADIIGDAIDAVKWCSAVIVVVMDSGIAGDRTAEVALERGCKIIHHPKVYPFDWARNCGLFFVHTNFTLVTDADERPTTVLGEVLLDIAKSGNTRFAALRLPFNHSFCGHVLQGLSPGFTSPRFFHTGKVIYNAPLHSDAQVDGLVDNLPLDRPGLPILHISYRSIEHYEIKKRRYCQEGEAVSLFNAGVLFDWRRMLLHTIQDFCGYIDNGKGAPDGPYWLIWCLESATYRMLSYMMLFEMRERAGLLRPEEMAVPTSSAELFNFVASALQAPQKRSPAQIVVSDSPDAADVLFCAPLEDPSGIGEECRNTALAAQMAGVNLAVHVLLWSDAPSPALEWEKKRIASMALRPVKPGFTHIIQDFPPGWVRHPAAGRFILRVLVETDRFAPGWVELADQADEIWTPAESCHAALISSGLAPERIKVVPEAFDFDSCLAEPEPTPLIERIKASGRHSYLAVSDWAEHKGWRPLLEAFCRATQIRTDIQLVLRVWSSYHMSGEQIIQQAREHVLQVMGIDISGDDRYIFLPDRLPREELISLYNACNCYALPSFAEACCRPYVEAMACSLPLIGSRCGGPSDYLTEETGYPVRTRMVPVSEAGWRMAPQFKGSRWHEPDVDHLVELMLHVASHPEEAAERAAAAKELVTTRFSRATVGKIIRETLESADLLGATGSSDSPLGAVHPLPSAARSGQALTSPSASSPLIATRGGDHPVKGEEPTAEGDTTSGKLALVATGKVLETSDMHQSESISVTWEGVFWEWHSLALVNREVCLRLLGRQNIDLSISPIAPPHFGVEHDRRFPALKAREYRLPGSGPRVHIRHGYPPRFERPDADIYIQIIAWEYGRLPADWVRPLIENVDAIWCYSETQRQMCIDSGIPAGKVFVISLGVDTDVFRPDALPFVITDEQGSARWHEMLADADADEPPFVFLFVGGAFWRKGIDALLSAWCKTFAASERVVLIIKDAGQGPGGVYAGGTEAARINELSNDLTRALVMYVPTELRTWDMPGLYVFADMVILPYLAEGFCLPASEALACGTAVATTEAGPTDAIVDDTVGWRIRSTRKPLGTAPIGGWHCCGEPWVLEPDEKHLCKILREAYSNRDLCRKKGEAGAKLVRKSWTWEQTAAKVVEEVEALVAREEVRGKREDARGAEDSTAVQTPALRLVSGVQVTDRRSGSGKTAKMKGRGPKPALPSAKSPQLIGPMKPADRSNAGINATRSSNLAPHDLFVRPRPRIALAVIGRDEASIISDMIDSSLPQVDLFVYLDTGSNDGTVDVVRRYAAMPEYRNKIYIAECEWNNSFAEARNRSFDLIAEAVHVLKIEPITHVLWLDCDDYMPARFGDVLNAACAQAEDRVMGFIVQVEIPPGPGEDGLTLVDHVKCVVYDPPGGTPGAGPGGANRCLRWTGRIHEQLLEGINEAGGIVQRLPLSIVHKNYDRSAAGQAKKRARDTCLLNLDEIERPDHPMPRFNSGMTAFFNGEYDLAIQKLNECLDRSTSRESTVRKVYAMLSGCYVGKGDFDNARKAIDKGLSLTPRDPELLFRAANLARDCGQPDEADRLYNRLLNEGERGHIDSIDVSITTFKLRHNMGIACEDLGRHTDAEAHYLASLATRPTFAPSLYRLGTLYARMRRFDDARALLARLTETGSSLAADLGSFISQVTGSSTADGNGGQG